MRPFVPNVSFEKKHKASTFLSANLSPRLSLAGPPGEQVVDGADDPSVFVSEQLRRSYNSVSTQQAGAAPERPNAFLPNLLTLNRAGK